MCQVSGLYIYPIKSLGGISLPSSFLTERGLQYDRRWMLVDENNCFLTQREHASMALLSVDITDNSLLLKHATGGSFHIPFERESEDTIMVDIWSDRCRAQPVSKEADRWFSDALSMKCRLVYMPDTTRRRVDGRYATNKEITSFSDGYPTLIIGESSLNDLNGKLDEKVKMDRFRPNIVFSGGEAYEEDNWEEFTIGNITFYGVKLCARCVLVTINQQTSEKGKEPLRTLSKYRQKNKNVYFGQNLLHTGEGIIHVGDHIQIIKKRETPRSFTTSDK